VNRQDKIDNNFVFSRFVRAYYIKVCLFYVYLNLGIMG
jgi:hypothetical protein